MKMGHALFWGLLLIILGFSLIFKIVFNIDFPLFKIIIAFIFIFIGLRILLGAGNVFSGRYNKDDVIFGERKYSVFSGKSEYNVVFGRGVFDFRDVAVSGNFGKYKISTVFGGSEIKISRNTPVRIRVDAAFSGVNLPNGTSAVVGNSLYESPDLDLSMPYLDLKLEAVFSGVDVKLY